MHCGVVRFLHSIVLPLPIWNVVFRGLAVKEWNYRVCGGVGVVPVIGQYLGLRFFSSTGWPGWHCHCPGNLWVLYFHSLSSSGFYHELCLEYVTEDSLCFTQHIWRNSWNMPEVKGGAPSVLSSSGVPYVWNSCQQMDINLDVVAWFGFRWYKMSQPVSLSAQVRYATYPTWNMSISIWWNGHSRDGVMVMGSHVWLGVMVAQIEQLSLKLHIEVFIPGQ